MADDDRTSKSKDQEDVFVYPLMAVARHQDQDVPAREAVIISSLFTRDRVFKDNHDAQRSSIDTISIIAIDLPISILNCLYIPLLPQPVSANNPPLRKPFHLAAIPQSSSHLDL